MDYEVSVAEAQESPTAVVAASTTWSEFPDVWRPLLDEVYAFVRSGGATQTGHNVMLYRDDVPNVEIGIEVNGPFAPSGRVISSVLPAGRVLRTTHRGPYGELGAAHDAVHAWAAEHGHVLTRVRWEIYGDWSEDPAALETEVVYQLV